jgi:hypothetical protein
MHTRKMLIGTAAVAATAAAVVAWYLFRPELLFINSTVSEALPVRAAEPTAAPVSSVLAKGDFHSVAHSSKGVATVHRLGDGSRVLRLTDFETSNGPALHVYLVAAADAADSKSVSNADTRDLGVLKGNKGDQNYDLSADIDLAKYRAVTIWCQRFAVNFATAPLAAPAEPR